MKDAERGPGTRSPVFLPGPFYMGSVCGRKDSKNPMMKILEGLADPHKFANVLLYVFLIAYFLYKEWPEFKKRVTKSTVDQKDAEAKDLSVSQRLDALQKAMVVAQADIASIKERQARDYQRLNDIEKDNCKQNEAIQDSLKERKLLMKGIMACLDGLEQLNCNHTVPETRNEIYTYLYDTSHPHENYSNGKDGSGGSDAT